MVKISIELLISTFIFFICKGFILMISNMPGYFYIFLFSIPYFTFKVFMYSISANSNIWIYLKSWGGVGVGRCMCCLLFFQLSLIVASFLGHFYYELILLRLFCGNPKFLIWTYLYPEKVCTYFCWEPEVTAKLGHFIPLWGS